MKRDNRDPAAQVTGASVDRLAAQVTERVRHLISSCPACAEREKRRREAIAGVPALSYRRLQVLQLAAEGLSIDQIATRLVTSSSTVKTHLGWLHTAFGVNCRVALVTRALRAGVIE